MPRQARQPREIFTCEHCGTKQPVSNNVGRSISCFGCGMVYAVVKDEEGGKALVPYFNQPDSISEQAE